MKVYLDYAATTPVDPQVLKAMEPYFTKHFGNTSSLHSVGQKAAQVLKDARQTLANSISAKSKEIIFTSSATESNNLAVKGIAWAHQKKGNHILVSSVEHDCVLNAALWLSGFGFKVDQLPVDKYGMVDPKTVKKMLKKDTILVSVMHANNEVGTINPISQIGKLLKNHQTYFHVDAAQTFGKMPLSVNDLKVDLLTTSSHKMYGPKGAAMLYKKSGIKIEPLVHGGGHERGLRSSTVNVPAIVGFAKAVEIAHQNMNKESKRLTKLRDYLIKGVLDQVPDSWLNGHPQKRLCNNVNLGFAHIEGEGIVIELDSHGIQASTGSACASASLKPSHVLTALGQPPQKAHGSLRLSLGQQTTKKQINYVIKTIPQVIKKLRQMSPFSKEKNV